MPIVVEGDPYALPNCGFTLDELATGYLKLDVDYDADKVQGALYAEWFAQSARCRIDVDVLGYATSPLSSDLQEALKRRVARNLAMRGIPLGVQSSELGGSYIGANDPEVRRLEAPYRRVNVG